MFEKDEEENRYVAVHHPFTSPNPDDIDIMETHPDKCRALAYDIIYNGTELGGGSIRIHSSDLQKKVFSLMGMSDEETQEKFGFMINSFKYGTPPHGGIALGLDRLVAMLAKSNSIREVIAFPKNSQARCLMTDAPESSSEKQLDELYLKLVIPKKK